MDEGTSSSAAWRRRAGWGLVAPLGLVLVGFAAALLVGPVATDGASLDLILGAVLALLYFGLPTLPAVVILAMALAGVLVLPARAVTGRVVRGSALGLLCVALAYGSWFLAFAERYDRDADLERRTRALVSLGADEPVELWLIERSLRARWPRGTQRAELVAGLEAAGFGADELSGVEEEGRFVTATIDHDPATRGLGWRGFQLRFELDEGGRLERIEVLEENVWW